MIIILNFVVRGDSKVKAKDIFSKNILQNIAFSAKKLFNAISYELSNFTWWDRFVKILGSKFKWHCRVKIENSFLYVGVCFKTRWLLTAQFPINSKQSQDFVICLRHVVVGRYAMGILDWKQWWQPLLFSRAESPLLSPWLKFVRRCADENFFFTLL